MTTVQKKILKHLGLFLAVFCLVSGLFFTTPAKKAVNEIYTSTHLGLYQKILPKIRIKFNPTEGKVLDWNTFIFEFNSFETEKKMIAEARLKNLKSIDIPMESMVFHLDLIFTPFLVFLFALLIATPLPWKKKLIAFFWGFLLLFVFQFFRVYLKMLWTVNDFKIGVYEYDGFAEQMLFYSSFVSHAGFMTMVTILIWILVVFNKENTAHVKKVIGI